MRYFLEKIFRYKPKIWIRYNSLIDPIFTFYTKNAPETKYRGWHEWNPLPKEEIIRRVRAYKAEWKKYEDKILWAISKSLGLPWRRSYIEVHIVSGLSRAISHPLIIKGGYTPDEFVDILTHELIHEILYYNEILEEEIPEFAERYEKETILTKRHITLSAVLKYIYLDVLKQPDRLERNLENAAKHASGDYSRAWEIVDKEGYKTTIKRFRAVVKNLG